MRRMTDVRTGQKAFTLTEMAIVMGAMGLILGAIWSVVGVVWNNYSEFRAREQVIQVVQNVRNYYINAQTLNVAGGSPCSTGDSLRSFLDDDNRRLIPIEMRETPDTAGNPLDHALAYPAAGGALAGGGSFDVVCLNNARGFRVTLAELKKESCMSLLMQFPVLTPEIGVSGIVAPNGTEIPVNLLDIADPAEGFPMTLTRAHDWCDQDFNNKVSFDFKLRN